MKKFSLILLMMLCSCSNKWIFVPGPTAPTYPIDVIWSHATGWTVSGSGVVSGGAGWKMAYSDQTYTDTAFALQGYVTAAPNRTKVMFGVSDRTTGSNYTALRYAVYTDLDSGPPYNWYAWWNYGSSNSNLGIAHADGDTAEIRSDGSKISAWVNGVLRYIYTWSSPSGLALRPMISTPYASHGVISSAFQTTPTYVVWNNLSSATTGGFGELTSSATGWKISYSNSTTSGATAKMIWHQNSAAAHMVGLTENTSPDSYSTCRHCIYRDGGGNWNYWELGSYGDLGVAWKDTDLLEIRTNGVTAHYWINGVDKHTSTLDDTGKTLKPMVSANSATRAVMGSWLEGF